MPLPALVCLDCIVPPQSLSVTMPGGAVLSASLPNSIVPSSGEIARQLFAQVNAALTPLSPVFAIMDAIKAIVDCVTAVPEAITKLDVAGLLQCAPDMVNAFAKVAAIFPPLSLPQTIRDILAAIIAFLEGVRSDLEGAKRQLDRIAELSTAAQKPGNAALLPILGCAEAFYSKVMEHTANSAAPLNKLLGLINMLITLIPGVQPIPCLGSLDGTPSVIQDLLSAFIDVLTIVRNLLPGGLVLNPYIPKGANC